MMSKDQLLLIRYLRSHGLQQGEIADVAGLSGHQVVGYTTRKLRKAFLDKHPSLLSQQAGAGSLLVGFSSGPCPQFPECGWCNLAHEEEHGSRADHCCPSFVKVAAYAQMEDLTKEQKLGVLLALLEEVESE